MSGIAKAVRKAGGETALADKVGTSRQQVQYWQRIGYVPAGWVIAVYDASGVSVHELNPECYPRSRVTVI